MYSRKLEMTVNHTNLTFSGLKCDLVILFSFTHSGVNTGGTKVYMKKKKKKDTAYVQATNVAFLVDLSPVAFFTILWGNSSSKIV